MEEKKRNATESKIKRAFYRAMAALVALAMLASSLGCDKNVNRTRRGEGRRVRIEEGKL